MYASEFNHELTKSTRIYILSKLSVAFLQHRQKTAATGAFEPQVQPHLAESKGEGLGVLPVKEAI